MFLLREIEVYFLEIKEGSQRVQHFVYILLLNLIKASNTLLLSDAEIERRVD